MNNSKLLFQEFLKQIMLKDSYEENRSVAYLVFENLFGLTRTNILAEKEIQLTADQNDLLKQIAERINKSEPIQYILGESEFFGRIFKVSSSVLIPRPETEELIRLVKDKTHEIKKSKLKILDIGTGSGCIAVTLALEIPEAVTYALDVSVEALEIAQQNTALLHAHVSFLNHDILTEEIPGYGFDVIVSNPPYIALKERQTMMTNVTDYEPHIALFVPDEDPLRFYNTIVSKSRKALNAGGLLAVEINELYGQQVKALFMSNGFIDIHITKDLSGKDRIVHGVLA